MLAAALLVGAGNAASLRPDSNVAIGDLQSDSDNLNMAVVNFDSTWGDVTANVTAMTGYVQQAAAENVNFLLFPEMAVTGYAYSDDPTSEVYQMPIRNAETANGPTATHFSQLAQQYDMWICYGGTEKVTGDDSHAYNTVFCCSPGGEVCTYEKIHPVEGAWCTAGDTPLTLETEWGKIGVSICYDTYAAPELERTYTAEGCRVLLNPTATSRGSYTAADGTLDTENWRWYYEDRLESISDRDGIYIASCDLTGSEYDANGNLLYTFPGGSCILGPGGTSDSGKYVKYYAGNTDWQASGLAASDLDLSLVYSVADGLLTTKSTVSDVLTSANFKPALYASWYADLARDGFVMASAPAEQEAVVSVVNFDAVWGDLDANLEKMTAYIKQAAQAGTNILVFPEMALQGYCYSSDPTSEVYRMAVDNAITCDSNYARAIADCAIKYDMYIVFGASESIPDSVRGNADQAYNSAFCCCPDGSVFSYQKIQPVEGAWCMAGSTPVIVETPYGALGLSICKDTYSYPELSRYYAAKGCTYIVNPTATSRGGAARWGWYYTTRLESTCDRDKVVIVSADLCGAEYGSSGNLLYTFPGGSCVMADLKSAENGSYVRYLAGTGEYEPTAAGLYTGTLELSDSCYNITYGCSIAGFSPELYTQWYAGLTTQTSASTAAIDSAYAFHDLDRDRWSAGYIYDLHAMGILEGYGDDTVRPEQTITRAEFAAMLAKASGADVSGLTESVFSDIDGGAWYAPYVAWAYQTGITVGTSANTFSPDAAITRQDMAVMLCRFAAYRNMDLTAAVSASAFADADDIGDYARQAVSVLQQCGVIHGVTGDSGCVFLPGAVASREQAADLLSLLLDLPAAA